MGDTFFWRYLSRLRALLLTASYYFHNRRNTGLLGKGIYNTWSERLALRVGPQVGPRPLWVHVAGPGDARAGIVFLERLWDLRPNMPVYISYGTLPARTFVENRLGSLSERHTGGWLPFDSRRAVRRFLRLVQPLAFVNMQGEFWPILLEEVHRAGIPSLALRVDMFNWTEQRDFPKWIRPLYERMLACVDAFSARSEWHAENLIALGVPKERVALGTDYRLDALPPADDSQREVYRALLGLSQSEHLAILIGPRPDELAGIAFHFANSLARKRIKLLVSATELDTVAELEKLLIAQGLRCVRRSRLSNHPAPWDAVLLDTHGELFALYSVGSAAVLGDTFKPVFGEGRNFWEPLRQGVPVIHGPGLPTSSATRTLGGQGVLRMITDYQQIPALLEEVIDSHGYRGKVQAAVDSIVDCHLSSALTDLRLVWDYLKSDEAFSNDPEDPRNRPPITSSNKQRYSG